MFFQVRKYLIPDSNDEIRQEQMREMELLTTAQTAPNLSPNTSKNPLSVTNSDGQDDIGSDETGSNSSAQVRKSTLEFGMNVAPWINVVTGNFGKKNKRSPIYTLYFKKSLNRLYEVRNKAVAPGEK